jgi:PhoPQ-activated pathogenicity-related protein
MEKRTLLCVAFLVTTLPCITGVDWDVVTPLDEYVHRDDGYFSWEELASYRFDTGTVYVINMTSQKYQDEFFSSRPIWWHIMVVAIPDNLAFLDAAALYIDGGNNNPDDPPPGRDDTTVVFTAGLANDTGCIAATIRQVPNQPVVFWNDPTRKSRTEDQIIAWTWRTYLDEMARPNKEILMRMPMTKAAKRGLDTIYEVAKQRRPETNVQRFMVSGASKRGWTTWSLAATDRRVVAMVPIGFSMINTDWNIVGHFSKMDGAWTFGFESYYDENLTMDYINPKAQDIWSVEDMYHYQERFTMPKLVVSATGDEYFIPDENWYWWNDIPDPKYLMMLPNSLNDMVPHHATIYETAVSFWISYLKEIPLPALSWFWTRLEDSGRMTMTANPPPVSIEAYRATTLDNDTRRDFRLASLDGDGKPQLHPVYWVQDLTVVDMGNGTYSVEADEITGTLVSIFLLGKWEGPTGYRMTFSTQLMIFPDWRAQKPCTAPIVCRGILV